jgi:hypothetical protein
MAGMQPTAPLPAFKSGTAAALALGVGLLVDRASDGPPGAGVVLAATVSAISLASLTHPGTAGSVFLLAGVAVSSFAVFRASPVLIAIDLLTTLGLLGLAAGFARGGETLRAGVRTFAVRGTSWISSALPAVAMLVRPLGPAASRRVPRAVAITLAGCSSPCSSARPTPCSPTCYGRRSRNSRSSICRGTSSS